MLNLHIPVFSVRSQMWSTGPVPTRLFHALGTAESTLYWHRKPYSTKDTPPELTHRDNIRLTRHLYGRQTRNGEIIFGGDRQLTDSKTPDDAGIEANRNGKLVVLVYFLYNRFGDLNICLEGNHDKGVTMRRCIGKECRFTCFELTQGDFV